MQTPQCHILYYYYYFTIKKLKKQAHDIYNHIKICYIIDAPFDGAIFSLMNMEENDMLKGKTIVVGVTGGIAAYKSAQLVSDLVKLGCDVHVVMTKNALNFITPITFETLTGHKCLSDTFDRNFQYNVEHVELSQRADLFLIAPATANIIGKAAGGIADDMLSTMLLAATCPILIAPAMNTRMYENAIVQENLQKLRDHGFRIIEPSVGRLACKDVGKGKLPDVGVLIDHIRHTIACRKDLTGLRVLITAGPTMESLDPVRFITNHSSGKMGYAIAQAAADRGAEVTLVSGPVQLDTPLFVIRKNVRSAEDMFGAVAEQLLSQDIVIMAAAVADYTPAAFHEQKIKKSDDDMVLPLRRTKDILRYAGENKAKGQIICGFSMETENLLENSRRKLLSKNCDLIAANSISEQGTGFGVDTNRITLITRDNVKELALMSKADAAHRLLDELLLLRAEQRHQPHS